MTRIVSLYATFPSDDEARRIGRAVVEEKLAACVNILGGCHSIYRWEGKVEEGAEIAALFKTSAEQADALLARIAQLHSYDVPAAVVWPIDASLDSYADWVAEESGR